MWEKIVCECGDRVDHEEFNYHHSWSQPGHSCDPNELAKMRQEAARRRRDAKRAAVIAAAAKLEEDLCKPLTIHRQILEAV